MRQVTFVVSPRRTADDVEFMTTGVGTIERCPTCHQEGSTGKYVRQQGRRFMEMILQYAHGYFWDGMCEVMREKGYMGTRPQSE